MFYTIVSRITARARAREKKRNCYDLTLLWL